MQFDYTIHAFLWNLFSMLPREWFLRQSLYIPSRKEEIFELYVNRIFLGNRSYGIEAAANTYFDKNIKEFQIYRSNYKKILEDIYNENREKNDYFII